MKNDISFLEMVMCQLHSMGVDGITGCEKTHGAFIKVCEVMRPELDGADLILNPPMFYTHLTALELAIRTARQYDHIYVRSDVPGFYFFKHHERAYEAMLTHHRRYDRLARDFALRVHPLILKIA